MQPARPRQRVVRPRSGAGRCRESGARGGRGLLSREPHHAAARTAAWVLVADQVCTGIPPTRPLTLEPLPRSIDAARRDSEARASNHDYPFSATCRSSLNPAYTWSWLSALPDCQFGAHVHVCRDSGAAAPGRRRLHQDQLGCPVSQTPRAVTPIGTDAVRGLAEGGNGPLLLLRGDSARGWRQAAWGRQR